MVVSFPTRGILQVTDKVVHDQGSGESMDRCPLILGIISLHPHPVNPTGLALVIAGNDDAGMETAARLFPIRTGVTASSTQVTFECKTKMPGPRLGCRRCPNGMASCGRDRRRRVSRSIMFIHVFTLTLIASGMDNGDGAIACLGLIDEQFVMHGEQRCI